MICSSFLISLGSKALKFHLAQSLGTGLVPKWTRCRFVTLRDLKFKQDTEIQTQTESYIENSKVIMVVLERFLHSLILCYTYSSCMDKENNGKNN